MKSNKGLFRTSNAYKRKKTLERDMNQEIRKWKVWNRFIVKGLTGTERAEEASNIFASFFNGGVPEGFFGFRFYFGTVQ
jgi:hypothetical protein